LKKKNRKLSRALINLKFRFLMRKPRMAGAEKRSKKRLDVLNEILKQMQ